MLVFKMCMFFDLSSYQFLFNILILFLIRFDTIVLSSGYSTDFLGGLFHSSFFLKMAAKAGNAKEKMNAGNVTA